MPQGGRTEAGYRAYKADLWHSSSVPVQPTIDLDTHCDAHVLIGVGIPAGHSHLMISMLSDHLQLAAPHA